MKTLSIYASALALSLTLNFAYAADVETKPITLCNESGLCTTEPVDGKLEGLCKKDYCNLTPVKGSEPMKLCSPEGLCETIPADSPSHKLLEPLCVDKDLCKLTHKAS